MIFVPVVVSLWAVSLLFKMLMDPEVGQLNKLFSSVGLPELQWLSSSSSALPTAVVIATWKGLGFFVVILTAGMLNIPSELYDAGLVDGTNPWQQFWLITMPLMSHTILLSHSSACHRLFAGIHASHRLVWLGGGSGQLHLPVQLARVSGSLFGHPLRHSHGRLPVSVRVYPDNQRFADQTASSLVDILMARGSS